MLNSHPFHVNCFFDFELKIRGDKKRESKRNWASKHEFSRESEPFKCMEIEAFVSLNAIIKGA